MHGETVFKRDWESVRRMDLESRKERECVCVSVCVRVGVSNSYVVTFPELMCSNQQQPLHFTQHMAVSPPPHRHPLDKERHCSFMLQQQWWSRAGGEKNK